MNKVRQKTHLAIVTTGVPLSTRCGKPVDLLKMTIKLANEGDLNKLEGVTCHWCRWGRGGTDGPPSRGF